MPLLAPPLPATSTTVALLFAVVAHGPEPVSMDSLARLCSGDKALAREHLGALQAAGLVSSQTGKNLKWELTGPGLIAVGNLTRQLNRLTGAFPV